MTVSGNIDIPVIFIRDPNNPFIQLGRIACLDFIRHISFSLARQLIQNGCRDLFGPTKKRLLQRVDEKLMEAPTRVGAKTKENPAQNTDIKSDQLEADGTGTIHSASSLMQ
jgi:hypothetical protein